MKKLAIIGTGIAGMGAAYHLKDHFDLTVYEKNNYIGGHTNTVNVDENGTNIPIDTGFMVFNKVTYPNLLRLFEELDVPIKPTSMSFSVMHEPSGLEYNGSGINGLFSQRRNIFNPTFIKMLSQINRFNKKSIEVLGDNQYDHYTLYDYVKENNYSEDFLNKYLIPMSSAVWSTPPDLMLKFPAKTLIQFFYNHGFLGLNTQHQWYTVVGGSQTYREKIIEGYADKITTSNPAVSVKRSPDKVFVTSSEGLTKEFDKVIFASHADETLSIISDPTDIENKLLSPFRYQPNKATLHTDKSVMPKLRRVWSSWNYRIANNNGELKTSINYYMNSLQQVSKNIDYFVSIDDPGTIDEKKIIKEIDYTHPLFSVEALTAQKELHNLNSQNNNTYFCGSYFKYGFHEDAYTSSLNLSRQLLTEKKNELMSI